ncbi:MAG: hypothetical protein ABI895_18355 [Deltaproteobacteria bacterium]
MKNDHVVQAVSVMSDDELDCVMGGTSSSGYSELVSKERPLRPVVRPSQGFLFDEDFDYPKRPFTQPR